VASTCDPEFLRAASTEWGGWCRDSRVLVEFIRFHPLLQNWRFFGGDVFDDRATVWIDLSIADLMTQYTTRVRTAIRKAVKTGLRVEWWNATEFLGVFPALYADTMSAIGAGDEYFFPPAYFERLLSNTAANDAAWMAVCRDDRQILAGAIFLPGAEMVEYHLSAANVEGKSRGATNLILHEAARRGQQAGKRQLHLGGGSNAAPDNPLLFFKAGFSSQRARFRIGRQIHEPRAYAALKADWDGRHGTCSNRILFYR
jgi:lipid II:glycine glycyltransferase (peptidoglycan interpeptide bridge formation enzyme)